MIKKYNKKKIEVNAVEYDGSNKKEIIDFTNGMALTNTGYGFLSIPTIEGIMTAQVGDFVIEGIAGEFYPCKPEIFKETYEEVLE